MFSNKFNPMKTNTAITEIPATQRPTHTPGPWRVKQTGFTYFRDLTILGEDWHGEETPIAAALVRNALHPYGRADKARAEIEANARLIAAAPELISALEAVLPDLEHYVATHGPGPDKRLALARAAIEKAKGGEQ